MTQTKTDQGKQVSRRGVGKPDVKDAFIRWYWTRPRVGTQAEFAKEHHVEPATLSDWKRTPEFRAKDAQYKSLLMPDFIEATSVMLELAKKGNVNAYRAAADVLGQKAPLQLEHSGRMTLSDFLAGGGYSKDETVARVN